MPDTKKLALISMMMKTGLAMNTSQLITPHWEHFEHQADMGVRGFGNTAAEAFEQAALAMCAIITDLSLIDSREEVYISCKEADLELLLVDWLNAIIFEMSTRKLLFNRFEVKLDKEKLSATAWGEPTNVERHQPAVEIKGATYTELLVHQTHHQWLAQCVVDV